MLLFAGKGGVGKTTLASATALRLARECPGKEVLLFSADPAHSLSDCLAMPVGPCEARICPGLTAIEVDAEAEFGRLKQQYVDEVTAFFTSLTGDAALDVAFDRDVVERIIDLAPPGLGATVQGLFTGVTMGLGAAAGAFVGGLLYDTVGPQAMFKWTALVVTLGLVVFWASEAARRRNLSTDAA